jgi:hypothetical protein
LQSAAPRVLHPQAEERHPRSRSAQSPRTSCGSPRRTSTACSICDGAANHGGSYVSPTQLRVQRPRAGRPLSECFRAAQRRSNDSAGRRNEQLVAARPLSERSIVFERLRGLLDLAEGGQVVALTSVAAFRAEQRPFGLVPGGRRSGERRRESEGAPFGSRSAFCDTLVQCGGLRCDCWC